MNNKSYFCINEPHVISELIDGEVVILNFDSGTYFSLNQSGMIVWQGLRNGLDSAAMSDLLIEKYRLESAAIKLDVQKFLEVLQAEALIATTIKPATAEEPFPYFEGGETPSISYEKPMLEKFTDLQDLLLLDPIHDVDDMGWPHQAG